MFALPSGTLVPEFDKFGVFAWDDALGKVGKNMARVLADLDDTLSGRLPRERP
jgi:hypothetical protein